MIVVTGAASVGEVGSAQCFWPLNTCISHPQVLEFYFEISEFGIDKDLWDAVESWLAPWASKNMMKTLMITGHISKCKMIILLCRYHIFDVS
jgi:hypothetical protein